MLSIRGIYTGTKIKPLEEIPVLPNVQVIITFLERDEMSQKVAPKKMDTSTSSTQLFLEKCGGWKDTRCLADIVTDIYASRTSSDRGEQIF